MNITDKLEFIKDKPARNRIVMPPMDTLMAEDGFANDFHIQHYGSRSYGGVGTIIVESTAVSEKGKIRDRDLGIWKDEHIVNLKKVSDVIKLGGSLAGIQINHAGAKADLPIPTEGVTNYFARYGHKDLVMLSKDDFKRIEEDFVQAARRAKEAGFDFIEIHGAHGYLLSEIISRIMNEVSPNENIIERASLVISIAKRIKEEIKIPVGIRISFDDHEETGMKLEEFKPLVEELDKYVDYFHVSSGEVLGHINIKQVISDAGTKIFRLPLAKEIKKWTSKPLIIVGNIVSREDVNLVLESEIDAVAIGKELLFNPNHVINNLISADEMDDSYHWNQNIWFDIKKYKAFKEKDSK